MLAPRYMHDGLPLVDLNSLQQSMKAQIEKKVADNIYAFEAVPCCICGESNFEKLSEKDRYGLYLPVCICRDCGLIQTNPRMTQASYNEFYNHEYRRLYGGEAQPSATFFEDQRQHGQRIWAYFNKLGTLDKLPAKPLILEIGCGAGGILHVFQQKGFQVIGYDLGEEYLTFGKAEYNLDLRLGTLTDYTGTAPHIVIYSHVLEHILDPMTELSHLRSIVAADGFLYLEMPGIRYLHRNMYRMDFLRVLQNAHTYHFTLRTLQNLLQQAGFALVDGNDSIRSLFAPSTLQQDWISDYDVLKYLQRLEFARRLLPITPYEVYIALRKLL